MKLIKLFEQFIGEDAVAGYKVGDVYQFAYLEKGNIPDPTAPAVGAKQLTAGATTCKIEEVKVSNPDAGQLGGLDGSSLTVSIPGASELIILDGLYAIVPYRNQPGIFSTVINPAITGKNPGNPPAEAVNPGKNNRVFVKLFR